jgi:hypothetical protein
LHNFRESLARGQRGEELFLSHFTDKVERLDGRTSDFVEIASGKRIELKSDFYDMRNTENFFFERYSDKVKKSPGGPWQALDKGSEIFIYVFVNNGCYFKFDTLKLVNKLNNLIPKLKAQEVLNRAWVTVGYKVPRMAVYDLMDEVGVFGGAL